MKLILVRHGETEENLEHILAGKNGGKLTQKGKDEAKKLGKELKEKYKIDVVFCSPLDRCVETLENILEEYPIEGQIFMSKLIEERDFGEYTGVNRDDIDWNEVDQNNKINKEMGIELLIDLVKRINLFLEDLKLEDENSTVLVISHYTPIRVMISKITGKKFDEIEVENTSITVFEKFK
jgi:broad specificity phosphatase PhoE